MERPHRTPAMLWILIVALAGAWAPARRTVHELHVTYGRMAVQGPVAVARLRFFRDDLEAALAHRAGKPLLLEVSPSVDSLFLAYLAEHFRVDVAGGVLHGHIVGSGDDVLDHEPAWWYLVRFDADSPIGDFRVRNTLLFDQFDDQKNLLTVVRFPDETQRSYTFSTEEETIDVVF